MQAMHAFGGNDTIPDSESVAATCNDTAAYLPAANTQATSGHVQTMRSPHNNIIIIIICTQRKLQAGQFPFTTSNAFNATGTIQGS